MTSADIVLPVPESPANSAVRPRPLMDVRPMPQVSSTTSRKRARDASSWSCSATSSGSTRSSQVTSGRTRRDSRSRPGRVLGAGTGLEVIGGQRSTLRRSLLAGRTARRAPSARGSTGTGSSPVPGRRRRPRHPARRSRHVPGPRCWASGASMSTGTPRDHAGSQGRRADEDHRAGHFREGTHRRGAAFGEHLHRPHDERRVREPALAGRDGRDLRGIIARPDMRARSSTMGGAPPASSAATAIAVPAEPNRSRT